MSIGWTRSAAAGALLLGGFAVSPALRGQGQDAPPLLPPPSLEQRVVLLEQVVAQQQAELDQLYRLADGLVAGADRLAVAADQARLLGFESAGANPAARTELLDGLWLFQSAIDRAAAPPEPAAKPAARK